MAQEPRRRSRAEQDSWAAGSRRRAPREEPQQPQASRRRDKGLYDDFDTLYDLPLKQIVIPRGPKKHRVLWAFVCLILLGMEAAIAAVMVPQLTGKPLAGMTLMPRVAFVNGTVLQPDDNAEALLHEKMAAVDTDRLMRGITIDGVDVGGMTLDEARAAVEAVTPSRGGTLSIRVNSSGRSWSIDSTNVPSTRNTEQALRLAYAQGRSSTLAQRGTGATPLEEQYSSMRTAQPLTLATQVTWDEDTIRRHCRDIAAAVTVQPVDAVVTGFNVNTLRFEITQEQAGRGLDEDRLFEAVMRQVTENNGTGTVDMEPTVLNASVTRSELQSRMGRISTYSTTTTNVANRNNNIRLSAQAINGTVVQPGETFSFNNVTGQRTAAKGYKEASAISGGASKPEVGGGVCQTSSTLFNAVARANLEIVSRSPHAWPSSYIAAGLDATVNWPGLDFMFLNDTPYPICIMANYYDRKVTVTIYGYQLEKGVTIDLQSKQTQTLLAPSGVKEVQNPELSPGTRQVTVEARNGSVWETWKVWYLNGKETKRELMFTSTYKAYQKTVEYN